MIKQNNKSYGGNRMENLSGVWEAIIALASTVFVLGGCVYGKAGKKELDEAKKEMATKLELKEFKEDMIRNMNQVLDTLSTRIDDRFDSLTNLINAHHKKREK